MKPTQEQIAEAAKRGLVEGARIITATGNEYKGTVNSPCRWYVDSTGSICNGSPDDIVLFWDKENRWATVITPAPSKEEGLKEGDAVKTTPKMRDAIVELARELGLLGREYSGTFPNLLYKERYDITGADNSVDGRQYHTPEAFIAKMRVTAAKPKPMLIDGYEVKYEKGVVVVGCKRIPNADVRAIAENLID